MFASEPAMPVPEPAVPVPAVLVSDPSMPEVLVPAVTEPDIFSKPMIKKD